MALTNAQTTKSLQDIRISVLDLAPIIEGGTPAEAFQRTRSLAQHTEAWGYHRYWLAEHHNIPGIASSATSVLMGYVAAHTSKIRVGSGGIMLPNHAPLVIAEQFGTLETLYPGRIDLGLGRAPGSDQVTARALRHDVRSGEDFPALLQELRTYFNPALAGPSGFRRVHAIPGEGLNMPIWLLGSSGFSAQLAGELGLPFAFAGQFSPGFILPALSMYRESFKPSEVLQEPYAMVGLNIIAADTDEQARKLATSQQQNFLNLVRGTPGLLKPPVEDMDAIWNEREKHAVDQQLGSSIVGGPASVKEQLEAFLVKTQADEMIINAAIYDHQHRLRSYEIVSEIWRG